MEKVMEQYFAEILHENDVSNHWTPMIRFVILPRFALKMKNKNKSSESKFFPILKKCVGGNFFE
jgi:hypothetical protein